MKTSFWVGLVALGLALPCLADSLPGTSCCSECGCPSIRKVCKVIPDVKKVTETRWGCECEDICLPGRSRRAGETCVPDCEEPGGVRKETVWEPMSCGRMIVHKKLQKQTVTVEKPGFKCVVQTVCAHCGTCRTP